MRVLKDKIMALSLEIIVFQTYDLGKKINVSSFLLNAHTYTRWTNKRKYAEKKEKKWQW